MASTFVLVCQNADCKARGAFELLNGFARELKESTEVEVKPYMCFGACQSGPNVVVYPQKVWYCNVRQKDVGEIAAHARGGQRVERLTEGVDDSLKELIFQLLDAGLF
jgi:(2Fe-2S) ferredoxin